MPLSFEAVAFMLPAPKLTVRKRPSALLARVLSSGPAAPGGSAEHLSTRALLLNHEKEAASTSIPGDKLQQAHPREHRGCHIHALGTRVLSDRTAGSSSRSWLPSRHSSTGVLGTKDNCPSAMKWTRLPAFLPLCALDGRCSEDTLQGLWRI